MSSADVLETEENSAKTPLWCDRARHTNQGVVKAFYDSLILEGLEKLAYSLSCRKLKNRKNSNVWLLLILVRVCMSTSKWHGLKRKLGRNVSLQAIVTALERLKVESGDTDRKAWQDVAEA